MSIKILCIADIHLGKNISFLPDEIKLSPQLAWNNSVELAISQNIDLVVIAGDIIDNENVFFDVYSFLEKGINNLINAKITTVVVAGNHDNSLIEKFENLISSPYFIFLGKDQKWERKSIIINGKTISFDGWSFNSPFFDKDPLKEYDLPLKKEDEIKIGVLHCDKTKSCYAPIDVQSLKSFPHDIWVLGHIHTPEILLQNPFTFYCGSLMSLDVSETNFHGADLIEIDNTVKHRKINVSSLLLVDLMIDLSNVEEEELDSCLIEKISSIDFDSESCFVGVNITLQGRIDYYKRLKNRIYLLEKKIVHTKFKDEKEIVFFITKIQNKTKYKIDLEKMANGKDPLALLCQKILILTKENSKEKNLLIEEMKSVYANAKLSFSKEENKLSDKDVENYLIEGCFLAIEELIDQKGGQCY
jgi:DNA repair protein SbcD/Mre11